MECRPRHRHIEQPAHRPVGHRPEPVQERPLHYGRGRTPGVGYLVEVFGVGLSARRGLQEKGLEVAEESFLEGLEKDEDLKTIQKALTKIRPLYSEVIIFYYFDNLPLKEIALILNKKENNIRVLLHRAMKALKEEVEKEEHLS